MLFRVQFDPDECLHDAVARHLRRRGVLEEKGESHPQRKEQGNRREQCFCERALLVFLPPQIPERDQSAANRKRKGEHHSRRDDRQDSTQDFTSETDRLFQGVYRRRFGERGGELPQSSSSSQPCGHVGRLRKGTVVTLGRPSAQPGSDSPVCGACPSSPFPAANGGPAPQSAFSRSRFIFRRPSGRGRTPAGKRSGSQRLRQEEK